MKDREINLMDLVVKVLLGWRVILVLMLVGGILLGGLGYIRSDRTQKAQLAERLAEQEQKQQGGEEYFLKKLTEVQRYNVCTVLENERSAEAQESYLQESVKMQIDAFNVPRTELVYRVEAEDLETAYQIEQIYEDIISGGLSKWLAEGGQEEISAAAMSELIELGVDAEDVTLMKERDSFRIVIYHVSEDQCLNLAERAEEYVRDQSTQLVKELGNHKVRLVSQNFSFVMDLSLWDSQQAVRNSILGLRSSCAKAKAGFSSEEWQYYNYMVEEQAETDSAREPERVTVIQPSVSPIYVLLGMFIFAFLYVIYVFLKYVLIDRVQITDDINAIFGVPELGAVPAASKKKKILAFVDEGILQLFNWNKRQFSSEKAIGLAATAVMVAARKESLQEVCCVGCDLQNDALAIADAIENTLKKENISMKVINDILYDQESMERIMSAKGAFLLEKAGGTLYDEIDRELKLLYRQDIKVLGVIVME